jgi:hypothetical protein
LQTFRCFRVVCGLGRADILARAPARMIKAKGLTVAEIAGEGFDLPERTALTREVMQAGAEVIYQAALVVAPWLGFADFLERVDEVSNFGRWSYEALDTSCPGGLGPNTSFN